jgi:hypothetical protein
MRSIWFWRRTVVLLITLALVVIAPDSGQAAKTFRWKLKQGDKFQVDMTQKIKQNIQAAERTIDVSQDMKMQMSWNVAQVDSDGTIHLQQTIDRITMTMQIPGQGEMKFDSASEEEPQGIAKMIADMLKPMVGAKMTQTMNDRGQVLDFEVAKEALEGLRANPMLKQFFSEDSLKEMMAKGSAVLPEEAIDKGHTWTATMEINSPVGKMKTDTTYVYQGEEKRGGKVLDKFGLKLAMSFGEGGASLAKIQVKDQDCSGTMYFDAEAGRLVETQMTQKMTLEVAVAGQQMNQKLDQTMLLTVTPAK